MAQLINVKLSRFDGSPWGFRLQGGKDFGTPLVVQKVSFRFVSFNIPIIFFFFFFFFTFPPRLTLGECWSERRWMCRSDASSSGRVYCSESSWIERV